MKKLIFAILFFGIIFLGFKYLTDKVTEPVSETNMTPKEAEEYLAELNSISPEGVQDSIMNTLKQCFEMVHAYKIYACLGTVIIDDEFIPAGDMAADKKGERVYDKISEGKPIIEMNFNRNLDSTEDIGVYDVSFMLLQESEQPKYQFYLEGTEVVRITKGEM